MVNTEVGLDAGRVWQLLSERKVLSVRKIGEMTSWRESHIYLALGWLARENKVRFSDQGGMMYVELMN